MSCFARCDCSTGSSNFKTELLYSCHFKCRCHFMSFCVRVILCHCLSVSFCVIVFLCNFMTLCVHVILCHCVSVSFCVIVCLSFYVIVCQCHCSVIVCLCHNRTSRPRVSFTCPVSKCHLQRKQSPKNCEYLWADISTLLNL